jgi:DNA-binding protein HU-beta
MNKTELVNAIASKTELSKKDVETVVNGFMSEVTECLQNKDKLSLVGFGNFQTRQRAARQGHNPSTGESISIPASTVAAWKPSKKLKELLN